MTGNAEQEKVNAVYIPQSIILTKDSGLSRNFALAPSEEVQQFYEQGKFGDYDFHTVFYDIFLSDDRPEILAVGPPFVNLEQHLLPAKITIDSRDYPLKKKIQTDRGVIYSAKIPPELHQTLEACRDTISKVVFANGMEYIFELQPALFKKPYGKLLTTQQHNNEIRWIKDWIRYYRKAFGVEHVVLYSNNSDLYQQEINELASSKVTIVRWNFPFGLSGRNEAKFYKNRFSQVGQLHHCQMRFANRTNAMFNFDNDELLVCKSKSVRKRIDKGEYLLFDSYWVPTRPNLPEDFSYVDFSQRLTESRLASKPNLYVTKGIISGKSQFVWVSPHSANWFGPVLVKLIQKMIKGLRIIMSIKRSNQIPVQDAYFLHYSGISTKWKLAFGEKDERHSLDHMETCTDLSVIEVLGKKP